MHCAHTAQLRHGRDAPPIRLGAVSEALSRGADWRWPFRRRQALQQALEPLALFVGAEWALSEQALCPGAGAALVRSIRRYMQALALTKAQFGALFTA